MNQFSALIVAAALLLPSLSSNAAPLPTQSGNEIGLTLGAYQYQEPGLMSLRGIKTGIDLRSTFSLPQQHTFLRGELRYAGGLVDYSSDSSGHHSNEPDWYLEGRALLGKDWLHKNSVVSSYLGLGYRFLKNDGRGLTTSYAAGYRRESNYFYLPLGVIFRTALKNARELISTVEYDHFLSGKQFTQLSDTGLGYSDLNNKQHRGYGMKLSIQYATPRWTLGPYLHYWNIAESEVSPVYQYGTLSGYGVEPANKTMEFGIAFGQPF